MIHSHRSTVGSRVHHRLRHRFMTEIHCVHALGTSSLAKNGYAQSCTRDLYLGTPYNSGVFRTPCWGEVAGFFLHYRCAAQPVSMTDHLFSRVCGRCTARPAVARAAIFAENSGRTRGKMYTVCARFEFWVGPHMATP